MSPGVHDLSFLTADTSTGNSASPSKNSGRYAAYMTITTAPTHHSGST